MHAPSCCKNIAYSIHCVRKMCGKDECKYSHLSTNQQSYVTNSICFMHAPSCCKNIAYSIHCTRKSCGKDECNYSYLSTNQQPYLTNSICFIHASSCCKNIAYSNSTAIGALFETSLEGDDPGAISG